MREFGTDKGEGGKNPKNLADVIYVRPLGRVGAPPDQLAHELGGVVGALQVVPVDGAVQRRQPLLGVGVVGVGAAPQ